MWLHVSETDCFLLSRSILVAPSWHPQMKAEHGLSQGLAEDCRTMFPVILTIFWRLRHSINKQRLRLRFTLCRQRVRRYDSSLITTVFNITIESRWPGSCISPSFVIHYLTSHHSFPSHEPSVSSWFTRDTQLLPRVWHTNPCEESRGSWITNQPE